MGIIRLTEKDEQFATKTANQINDDYPGSAFVYDGACYVTRDYYHKCKKYVHVHCQILDGEKKDRIHKWIDENIEKYKIGSFSNGNNI